MASEVITSTCGQNLWGAHIIDPKIFRTPFSETGTAFVFQWSEEGPASTGFGEALPQHM